MRGIRFLIAQSDFLFQICKGLERITKELTTANEYNLLKKLDQKIRAAKVVDTMKHEEELYSEVQSRGSA